jgi:hypothetical protein
MRAHQREDVVRPTKAVLGSQYEPEECVPVLRVTNDRAAINPAGGDVEDAVAREV